MIYSWFTDVNFLKFTFNVDSRKWKHKEGAVLIYVIHLCKKKMTMAILNFILHFKVCGFTAKMEWNKLQFILLQFYYLGATSLSG